MYGLKMQHHLADIAQGVCNNPLGQIAQSVLGQNATDTCKQVNLNANIVSNAPFYGITIIIFGFILIAIGRSSDGKKTTIVDIEDIHSKYVSLVLRVLSIGNR